MERLIESMADPGKALKNWGSRGSVPMESTEYTEEKTADAWPCRTCRACRRVNGKKMAGWFATEGAAEPLKNEAFAGPVPGISKSASLPAVDFDAVKNLYYNARGNIPCSVDAATWEHDGVYLVEFKCGGADRAQLVRKIYDSIMLLIEHDNYTFRQARTEVHYVVVSAELKPWSALQKTLSRACGFMKEPWKNYRKNYDHWQLEPLEGVIVRSAYTMSPDMFDYFAKYKRWV